MRKMLYLFFILLSLQSCSVYHSRTVSLEEAVESQDRVKVVTENDVTYKFRQLRMEDGYLAGVTPQSSNTAKKLAGLPAEKQGKFLFFDLSEVELERIQMRNKSLSMILSIGIPLVVLSAAALGIIIVLVMSSF